MKYLTLVLTCLLWCLSAASAATLDDVKSRGKLRCGVNPGLIGFAAQDADGKWSGFDEDFFREKEMNFTPVVFGKIGDLVKNFDEGKCDTYTADLSQLYAIRLRLANPDDSLVLPDAISREPLGPAIRQGDDQWFNIVRWTLFALINAEELEITAAGANELKTQSKKPSVRRLLGAEGTFGVDLGLDAEWAPRAIKAVGNYGEIFERNLGAGSPLRIERGLNALWNKGGLLYAPPVR